MTRSYPFESDGSYSYGFTSSGLFTLITKDGEPLYAQTIPLAEKLASHLLWTLFWVALSLLTPLFMPLIIVHLFIFGCRLTTLLIKGGVRPLLFPPLWIRLTRALQKEPSLAPLKKHNLQNHPGLLSNLALIHYTQNRPQQGRETLQKALSLSDHPDLLQISENLIERT